MIDIHDSNIKLIAEGRLAIRFNEAKKEYDEIIVIKDSSSHTSSTIYQNQFFKNLAEKELLNIKKIIYNSDCYSSYSSKKLISDQFRGEVEEKNILDSVEEIILPHDLEEICAGCFYGLKGLKRVIIPDSVKKIHAHAFEKCTGLIDNNIVYCSSKDNKYKWAVSCEKYDLEEIKINPQTEIIADYCFYLMGRSSYRDYLKLKKILIPKNINKIGEYAFGGVTSLEDIVFEEDSLITELPEGIFAGCTNLKNIKFHHGLEVVNSRAFHSCEKLEYIDLTSIKQIKGELIFYNTPALKKVVFGKNLELMENNWLCRFSTKDCYRPIDCFIFDGNNRYENVDGIIYNKIDKIAMYYSTPKASLRCLKPGTKKINDCFLDFDESLKTMGINMFKKWTIEEGIEEIGYGAFSDCGIQILNLPSSIRKIGKYCFSGNPIYEINMFSSVKNVDAYFVDNFTYQNVDNDDFYFDKEKAKQGLKVNLVDLNKSMNDEIIINDTLVKYININNNKFYEVPKNVKRIVGRCFNSSNISTLVLHENLEIIDDWITFNDYTNPKIIYYNCINAKIINEYSDSRPLIGQANNIRIVIGKYVSYLPKIYESNFPVLEIEYEGTKANFQKIKKEHIASIRKVVCTDGEIIFEKQM